MKSLLWVTSGDRWSDTRITLSSNFTSIVNTFTDNDLSRCKKLALLCLLRNHFVYFHLVLCPSTCFFRLFRVFAQPYVVWSDSMYFYFSRIRAKPRLSVHLKLVFLALMYNKFLICNRKVYYYDSLNIFKIHKYLLRKHRTRKSCSEVFLFFSFLQ